LSGSALPTLPTPDGSVSTHDDEGALMDVRIRYHLDVWLADLSKRLAAEFRLRASEIYLGGRKIQAAPMQASHAEIEKALRTVCEFARDSRQGFTETSRFLADQALKYEEEHGR
jgi:hypothetical protein